MNKLKIHLAVLMAMSQGTGKEWENNQKGIHNSFSHWEKFATKKSKVQKRKNKKKKR